MSQSTAKTSNNSREKQNIRLNNIHPKMLYSHNVIDEEMIHRVKIEAIESI